MKWFGEPWGAPVCEPEDRVPCPEGRECAQCSKALLKGDQGLLLPFLGAKTDPPDLPYHLECLLGTLSGRDQP